MEKIGLLEEYIEEARLRCKTGEYLKALEILERARVFDDASESQIKKIDELIEQIERILETQRTNYRNVESAINDNREIEEIEQMTGMSPTTIQVAREIANVEGRTSSGQKETDPKEILRQIEQCIRIGDLAVAIRLIRQAQGQERAPEYRKELERLSGQIYQKQRKNGLDR